VSKPEQAVGRRTAFVLDDEVRVATIVCKALSVAGLAAYQFAEPHHFLMQVKVSAPDLVVLDLALGQTDAVEIIRKLEILKFKGKVLLISGRHEGALAEIEQIGRAHGLDMLPPLGKPFRVAELRERLDSTVARNGAPKAVEPAATAGAAAPAMRMNFEEALRNHWLELYYQPKVDLRSLKICGAEALIRGRHPHRGTVAPADLLPPPGDPLYKPLSVFVIRQALAEWGRLAEHGFPIKLAVNVPASVLSEPTFVGMVRQLIPSDRSFPGLTIEVTEDEIIRNPEWMREIAIQLRLYNVSISIDDFGSAYASLSRLKDLPFREIKLDRSFVTGCAGDALKRGLCTTVVDLARRFSASACAEGVESVEDLRCLSELGFDTAQGFLFAKPMRPEDFVDLLVARAADPDWGIDAARAPPALPARA